MAEPAVSRAPRWLRAARVVHPVPTLMNVAATGAVALIASRGGVAPVAVAHLMLAMLAIQASIGIVNDLADLDIDSASRRAKPLTDGSLSVLVARAVAAVCIAAAIALSAGFGAAAWLLAMAGLACGLVYDIWLKRTAASALPYVVALPLLPLWVWVALGRFRPALLALIPLACLLGLALHLANGLTDFDSDGAAGVRGLAQRLGKRLSLLVCWGSFALALVLVLASGAVVASTGPVLLAGVCFAALALMVTIALYWRHASQGSLRIGWGLLVIGSAAMALSWLTSLPG